MKRSHRKQLAELSKRLAMAESYEELSTLLGHKVYMATGVLDACMPGAAPRTGRRFRWAS